VFGLGCGLCYLFWSTLWHGGGWIGGDIYTYYFPQKLTYQESLARGEWTLWNDLVAHGYPQMAESQTGVFYPFASAVLLAFELCRAYHLNQLLHYVLAFAGTVLLARGLRLSPAASLLAGAVYTYGWFPARASLEWAIIGGAWLPFGVWATERFLVTGRWRHLLVLAAVVALQLLAGHFVIAFLTMLTTWGYALGRSAIRPSHLSEDERFAGPEGSTEAPAAGPNLRALAGVAIALASGMLLAGVQLVPTWELKQHSQRDEEFHDIGYGHLPPQYLAQVAVPWKWYPLGDSLNDRLHQLDWLAIDSATNPVEAHLYFGLLPLALALLGLLPIAKQRPFGGRTRWLWWGLAGLSVSYAFGWWLPLTRGLPGFSFFIGPGRYGLIATLALALLSAESADALLRRLKPIPRRLVWMLAISVTIWDLFLVSRLVSDATIQTQPAFELREFSPTRQYLLNQTDPVRLHAPGQNLPSLLGVSAVPQYLGLSPREYFHESTRLPDTPQNLDDRGYVRHDAAFSGALRRAGVTHLLSQQPLSEEWPCRLVLKQSDPFLNAAWGRGGQEPIYLYELENPCGRADWFPTDLSKEHRGAEETSPVTPRIEWIAHDPTRHELQVFAPGNGRLVVSELLYPGWKVEVDGQPREPLRIEGMFRGVELTAGTHRVTWEYRPVSFRWGAGVSLATLCLVALVCCVRLSVRGRKGPQ
jgi:hypothetical protein